MSQSTFDLFASLGLMALIALPLLGVVYALEHKQEARSRKMLGKGKSINLRKK